jgi:TIR domain
VQALTPTLSLCYAAADGEVARRIAAFIERGASVRVLLEGGEMRAGEDLAEKARQALGSDMALVLFSRESLPPRWPRAQWEGALVNEPAEAGVRIAFVRCDDCAPPRVLAPMFEANALRPIKRWARGHMPAPQGEPAHDGDLEVLGIAIADRPGADSAADEEIARHFIRAYRQDFDAVLEVECGSRSLAALLGDLGAQLELRLEGDVESNLARLHEFCAERRVLIALKDDGEAKAGEAPLEFGGRCSTLRFPGTVAEPRDESIRGIQRALRERPGDWSEYCRLARLGRRLTRDAGRVAECHEMMAQWHAAAEARDDRKALDESARELVWILESWGRADEAYRLDYIRATEFDEQMGLPFGM